jgi:hypothetical protein
MSEAERLLSDLWAADEPAARDHAFTLSVMEKVERRRFLLGMGSLLAAAFAAGAALWALAPEIETMLAAVTPVSLAPAVGPAVVAAVAAAWLLGWGAERAEA